ncbi:MAG: glutathione S-transferase family protein [Pseudomonadota bacterium]
MQRLYHFSLSPFCRKVRLVLAEKGQEVELFDEQYWEKRPDFMRLNPAGQVPVLRNTEVVLPMSSAICEYLEERHPDPPLLPKTVKARAEVRRLVGWFDDKFYHEVTQPLLNERVMKKLSGQGHPESTGVKSGLKAARFHLDYMNWLLDRRRWLGGDSLSLADFAAAAHLSCLDYISDVDWTRSSLVKEWYATIKSRPAFRSLLADQLPGFPPARHYSDLDF